AAIERTPHELACTVKDLGIVIGKNERRIPVEAMLDGLFLFASLLSGFLAFLATFLLAFFFTLLGDLLAALLPRSAAAFAAALLGGGTNGGCLAGAQIARPHGAVLAFVVNRVGVMRIDPADEAVAAAERNPIFVDGADAALEAMARTAPRAVVLQAA